MKLEKLKVISRDSRLWNRLLLALFLATLSTGNTGTAAQGFSRAPYLQMATANSIYLVWRTQGPTEPMVKYGPAPDQMNRTIRGSQIAMKVYLGQDLGALEGESRELLKARYARLPKLHSAPPGTLQYEAGLKGLKPDTRYYYSIWDGEERMTPESANYTFVTHPLPGQERSARIWVVGDSGVGREPQLSVHRAMVDLIQPGETPLDMFIHVGDMAYVDGKDREFQRSFFEVYESTLRKTVCWPAMGNHEGHTSRGKNGTGPYYDAYVIPTRGESGGLASGTEAYYSFDYGRIHFICLDSHDLDRKPTGAMARWLKADLDRTSAEWLVAFWHHPPYTMGSHNSNKESQLIEMRQHIMPILEAGGVDLVLTGHSHIYERSMLMDGAYATPTVARDVIFDDGDGDPEGDGPYRKSTGLIPHNGTVQIVAGHGGADLSRKGTMPVMKRMILEHGSVILDVAGNTLNAIMLNNRGVKRDQFSIVKAGRIMPTRLANPKVLPPYDPSTQPARDGGEELPDKFITLIEKNSQWSYLAGKHPTDDWTELEYSASEWKTGKAGIGYGGSGAHETVLGQMRGRFTTVYLRRAFVVENASNTTKLGLVLDYDDGFIAYLNGQEVLRKNVSDRGAKAHSVNAREAANYHYYPIENFADHLRDGRNVLAIEGHNRSLNSSDFTLDPYLLMDQ